LKCGIGNIGNGRARTRKETRYPKRNVFRSIQEFRSEFCEVRSAEVIQICDSGIDSAAFRDSVSTKAIEAPENIHAGTIQIGARLIVRGSVRCLWMGPSLTNGLPALEGKRPPLPLRVSTARPLLARHRWTFRPVRIPGPAVPPFAPMNLRPVKSAPHSCRGPSNLLS
jgi:hypothetical protein